MKSGLSVPDFMRRLAAAAPNPNDSSRCFIMSFGIHAIAMRINKGGSRSASFMNVKVFIVVNTVSSQGCNSPVSRPPKSWPKDKSPMRSVVK